MQDLNLRPIAPKAIALPNCANPRIDGANVIHLKDVTEACPLSRNQLVQMLESEATPTDCMRPIKREGEHIQYNKKPRCTKPGSHFLPTLLIAKHYVRNVEGLFDY